MDAFSNAGKDTHKDLIRYLLEQVKGKGLDKARALNYLQYLESTTKEKPADVAVIGMSCRFPDADSKEEYWHNLAMGRSSIRPFPTDRKRDLDALGDEQTRLFNGGFLENVNQFDNEYFNIPPVVARHMDPYHRMLLESFVETIEDAGYNRRDFHGSNTGIFVGNDHTHRFFNNYLAFIDNPDFNSITGSWTAVLASRIAYLFNMQGPAVVIDTSCSSSLVAIDSAIKALRAGDCECALIGAANIFFAPGKGIVGDVENEDFIVRTFDQAASGTVWGEGVASILLKPLASALEDGDSIYGVIKGTAVNNDGASNGITAPNARAQQQVLEKSWKRAGISPEELSYIESHGTGTNLGDPIEIRGLSNAVRARTSRKQFCGIGSVKTNIGHTVGVAGLASLIKVLLCFQNQKLAPSLYFNEPNSLIDFCNSPVYVVDKLTDWSYNKDQPRFAGISSFSLSGTNCHIVVSDPPVVAENAASRPMLFLTSARSRDLLLATLDKYVTCLSSGTVNFIHTCYTAAIGRDHQGVRLAVIASDTRELAEKLSNVRDGLTRNEAEFINSKEIDTDILMSVSAEKPQNPGGLDKQAAELLQQGIHADLRALAMLFVDGARCDWSKLFTDKEKRRVHLPAQAWRHNTFWFSPKPKKEASNNLSTGSSIAEISLQEIISQPCRVSGCGLSDDRESGLEKIIGWHVTESLGFETLNENDDYFSLGGDSVLGARIVQRINDTLGTAIQISDLMITPRLGTFIRQQARRIATTQDAKNSAKHHGTSIPVCEPAECYALSRAQERMFILADRIEIPATYNVNALLEIDALPDPEETRKVLLALMERHEVLRSGFRYKDTTPVQFPVPISEISPDIKLHTFPVADADSGETEEQSIARWARTLLNNFSLEKPPLFSVHFTQHPASGRSYMFIDMHHIITDGASMGILISDFLNLSAGKSLSPLNIQYRDFAHWHNQKIASPAFSEHADYWKSRLAQPVPETILPLDSTRPVIQSFIGKKIHTQLATNKYRKIKDFASDENVSLFMLLNTAFRVLLYKYVAGTDIVIGSPVSGRQLSETRNLIGMFVNTLAFRFQLCPESSFRQNLQKLKKQLLLDFSHQDYPFEALVETLGLPRDTSRNPLFDVYFVFQNEDMGLTGEGIRVLPFDSGTARFDLTVIMREENSGALAIDWEFSSALFNETTINKLAGHFEYLLDLLCELPDTAIFSLNPLDNKERSWLLEELNQSFTMYPAQESLNALFEAIVVRWPDHVALTFLDGQNREDITYIELNSRANRLAQYLIQSGVLPGQVLALYLPRGPEMVVAILACLKAGCAYVPVDANNPVSRNTDIVDDSAAVVVLGHSSMENLTPARARLIHMDKLPLQGMPDENPPVTNDGDSLAYLMYTSGTTGKPKAACIRHKSVTRVVVNTNYLQLSEQDVCLQLSSFAFDGCVPDLYGALLNGGRLVLPSKELTLDPVQLGRILQEEKITSMFVTTALFNVLVDNICEKLCGLNNLMFGGEACSPRHVETAFNKMGPGRLIHVYGPTETTVFATAHVIQSLDNTLTTVPIGKPITCTSAYILNDKLQAVPQGVIGELYIGGDGLADGYLNRPELTQQYFIKNPFKEGERLYRSGDLVKRLADGNIVYIGRRDTQVKIRGFRIEPDEIRSRIIEYPDIIDVAITAEKDHTGTRQLLAWLVVAEPGKFNCDNLAAALRSQLPDYMVPQGFTALKALPLNNNGKLDRSRLPEFTPAGKQQITAKNDIENVLVSVWQEVLLKDTVSTDDNFFSLGGDSIKGVRVVAKLHGLGIPCKVSHIFQFPTIQTLARYLESHIASDSNTSVARQDEICGSIPLSPIQAWFLSQDLKEPNYFNHTMWIQLEDVPSEAKIESAFSKLLAHHDALRTRFSLDHEGKWQAEIIAYHAGMASYCSFNGDRWALEDECTQDHIRELQKSLDIEKAKNTVVGIFRSGDNSGALCIAIHHLVVDVVSWQILLEDLQHCLTESTNHVSLPAKTCDVGTWNKNLIEQKAIESRAAYWHELENSEIRRLSEKNIVAQSISTLGESEIFRFSLEQAFSEQLLGDANLPFTTEPVHLLLCALGIACETWRGKGNTLIQLESYGRQELNGLQPVRTVGWFTSIFPHILFAADGKIENSIISVKEHFRSIPEHGRDYLLLTSPSNGNLANSPGRCHPEISFNFLGNETNANSSVSMVDRKLSSSPYTPQPFLMDIVVFTAAGNLVFEILYDTNRLNKAELDNFICAYKGGIEAVINACKNKNTHEKTASDFSAKNLKQADLEEIIEDLEIL